MGEDPNFVSNLFGLVGALTLGDLTPFESVLAFFGVALSVAVIVPTYTRILRNMVSYSIDKKKTELKEEELRAALQKLKALNSKESHSRDRETWWLPRKVHDVVDESSKEGGSNRESEVLITKMLTHRLEDGEAYRKRDGSPTDDWRTVMLTAIERLSGEADRLRSKSVTNLTLGVVFSTFAVIVLILLLIFYGAENSVASAGSQFISYLPRLTIAALLQVVAIFFLKLHASVENDLKQNKNEITNIELKIASGLALSIDGGISAVAVGWGREERNFVIDKNQKVASQFDVPDIESLLAMVSSMRPSEK